MTERIPDDTPFVPEVHGELISAYLDGELRGPELDLVQRWLSESPACRQLLDELRALGQALEQVPQLKLEDDFALRVIRRAERIVLTGAPGEAAAASMPKRESSGADDSPVDLAQSQPGPKDTLLLAENRDARRETTTRWRRPLVWSALAVAASLLILVVTRDSQVRVGQVLPPANGRDAPGPDGNVAADRGRVDRGRVDRGRDASPGGAGSVDKDAAKLAEESTRYRNNRVAKETGEPADAHRLGGAMLGRGGSAGDDDVPQIPSPADPAGVPDTDARVPAARGGFALDEKSGAATDAELHPKAAAPADSLSENEGLDGRQMREELAGGRAGGRPVERQERLGQMWKSSGEALGGQKGSSERAAGAIANGAHETPTAVYFSLAATSPQAAGSKLASGQAVTVGDATRRALAAAYQLGDVDPLVVSCDVVATQPAENFVQQVLQKHQISFRNADVASGDDTHGSQKQAATTFTKDQTTAAEGPATNTASEPTKRQAELSVNRPQESDGMSRENLFFLALSREAAAAAHAQGQAVDIVYVRARPSQVKQLLVELGQNQDVVTQLSVQTGLGVAPAAVNNTLFGVSTDEVPKVTEQDFAPPMPAAAAVETDEAGQPGQHVYYSEGESDSKAGKSAEPPEGIPQDSPDGDREPSAEAATESSPESASKASELDVLGLETRSHKRSKAPPDEAQSDEPTLKLKLERSSDSPSAAKSVRDYDDENKARPDAPKVVTEQLEPAGGAAKPSTPSRPAAKKIEARAAERRRKAAIRSKHLQDRQEAQQAGRSTKKDGAADAPSEPESAPARPLQEKQAPQPPKPSELDRDETVESAAGARGLATQDENGEAAADAKQPQALDESPAAERFDRSGDDKELLFEDKAQDDDSEAQLETPRGQLDAWPEEGANKFGAQPEDASLGKSVSAIDDFEEAPADEKATGDVVNDEPLQEVIIILRRLPTPIDIAPAAAPAE